MSGPEHEGDTDPDAAELNELTGIYGQQWAIFPGHPWAERRRWYHAIRRLPLPGPQDERPGHYNVLIAESLAGMREALARQSRR